MRVLGRSWKSPGNLFQKKGTNPERHVEWGKPKAKATKLCKARPQGRNCIAMAQLRMPAAIIRWPTADLPVNSDY